MEVWKKLKDKKMLIIIAILIIFGIPIIINLLLYTPIRTNSTNDSDWLSFWGSFLGGILGGTATLLGVKSTIKQMNIENKVKYRTVIMPYKSNYNIYISMCNGENCKKIKNYIPIVDKSIYENYKNGSKKIYSAYIYLINISLYNAIDVSVTWNKPSKEKISTCIKERNYEVQKIIDKIDNLVEAQGISIPLIRSSQVNGFYEIPLYEEIKKCLFLLTDLFDKNGDDINIFPVGTLKIKSHDIYGQEFTDEYDIKMTIQCYAININYDIKLEFFKTGVIH